MSENLIVITKENFKQEVRESELPVLLDFWGPNCRYCDAIMPTVEELSETYAGKIKFCKLNTAENRHLARQFKIMSIPTLLFFKDGEVVAVLRGAVDPGKIEGKLKVLID